MTESVTGESVEIAGVQVRSVSVSASGHTVEELLFYNVAEAEAVHGRPFDDELDGEIQMAMFPPAPNGQRALAVATDVPALADWTDSEKMRGEYRGAGALPPAGT